MATYKVTLGQTVEQYALVVVEADSPEEAEAMALEEEAKGAVNNWENGDCHDFRVCDETELLDEEEAA